MRGKKFWAWLLTAALLLGMLPVPAMAAGLDDDVGYCPHHTEHTAECGYITPTGAALCQHEHTAECWQEETVCVHTHTEDCYSDGVLPVEGEEKDADICAHVCMEESGCVTLVLDCQHEHDGACGYAPADPGRPCGYVCRICPVQALLDALPDAEDITDSDRASVEEQLAAIDEARMELTDEETDQLDTARYQAVISALLGMLPVPAMAAASGDFEYSVNSDNTVTITKYTGSNGDVEIPSVIDGNPVTAIGEFAFYYNSALKSVVIPNGVTTIGEGAFGVCHHLAEIELPDSLTSIGSQAFGACYALRSINIPNGVETIGVSAFMRCTSLASIELPKSVKTIEFGAFSGCDSLKSIEIPNGVTTIGQEAFARCNVLNLIVLPNGCQIGDGAIPDGATQMKYTVDGDNVTINSTTLGSNRLDATLLPTTIGGKPFTVENCEHKFGSSYVDNGDGRTHIKKCALCKEVLNASEQHSGNGTCDDCGGKIAAAVTITWGDPETLTYTGQPAAITPPTVAPENAASTISYSYAIAGGSNFTNGLPTGAGTYTVRAVVPDSTDYIAASADTTLMIAKASNSITSLTCDDIVFGGTPDPSASASFGTPNTYTYSNSESGTYGDWDTSNAVGTWWVKASVIGTTNYEGAEKAISFLVTAEREPTPNASINYTDETLTGLENGASYSITPAGGAAVAVDASSGTVDIREDWFGKTLSIVKPARDDNYSDSEAQSLPIPQRPTAPALDIDTTAESMTISADYFYGTASANYAQITSKGDGGAVTVAPGASIYIYKAATNSAFKSAIQTITAPSRGQTPALTISTATESVTVPAGYRYGTTGADFAQITSEGDGGAVTVVPGESIYIYKAATSAAYKSAIQTITAPSRGQTPALAISTATESVTVPAGYRYGTTGANYAQITSEGDGGAVTVAPGASIYIYKAATSAAYKSDIQTITAPDREQTPAVSINFTTETLDTTTAMEYSADGGTSWTACGAGMAAAAFTGWDGTSAVTVQFRAKATDNSYASESQTALTIPARPNAPATAIKVTKTSNSITINGDGFSGCQFSVDGTRWQDSGTFSSLTPGQEYPVSVRAKATNTAFASYSQTMNVVTVKADGSTTVKPGESVTTGGGTTITNDGDKTTIESGGTTTTVTPCSNAAVNGDGSVDIPSGSTVQTGSGPEITLPSGGTVSGDGGVTVPSGGSVQVDDTTITPPSGGEVKPKDDGTVDVPGGSTVQTGDGPEITVGPGNGGTVGGDGGVTVPDGGSVQVGDTTITPPNGGEVKPTGGGVTVPGGSTVQTGSGPEITVGPGNGGTVGGDGGVTVPGGGSVQVGDTTITLPSGGGTVTPAPGGNVTAPGGSTVTKGDGTTTEVPSGGGSVNPDTGEVTLNTHTVTFDSQGGSAVPQAIVTHGGKLSAPANPTRSGYDFGGWYKESACTTAWNFDTNTVTGDITLYAKWTEVLPDTYTVAFNSQGGSTVSSQTVTAGGKATKPSNPTRSGYNFGGWYKESGCTTAWNFDTDVVTGNITLYAKWTAKPTSGGGGGTYTPPTYPPTVEKPNEGGTVTISPSRPSAGDKVTVRPKPDSGYEVDKITVTDRNGKPVTVTKNPDGTYTFTQPNGTVKVEVSYKTTETKPADISWSNSYQDISENSWYYDAVRFVSENGLMNGYSNGMFGPNDYLSRAQLAQILFNKEGRPGVNYLLQFGDVSNDTWYTEAVRWAASQGIVGGYGNGMFGPNDNITREQLAVMLWRYAGSPAATNKELHFNDIDETGGFAMDALYWAVENGILNGYGDGRLGPKGLATRAQVAQMLKNYLEDQ